jgi:hypothetical protein
MTIRIFQSLFSNFLISFLISIIPLQVISQTDNGKGSSLLYPDQNASVTFSVNSGFFKDPFSLTITSGDPAAAIIFTLDGSNPQSSSTADTVGSTASITVDPSSSAGRPVTPGFLVRASLYKAGYKPSEPVTKTFIFIESVKTQSSSPGGGWPTASINDQVIDLATDPEVVNNPLYKDLIDDALVEIPSISIVTELGNLFDPDSGIYVNADGHGLDWERECNTELINPDGSEGFNIGAGLRIRGGWSRHDYFPKHAFRLFFREEYGSAKLNYPLFGEEGASQFDKIDIRCEQNYAWSNGSEFNSMVRDVFSRDTQRDMKKPYTRSRYYHLYLNGMYWGLYQTQERADANFAETYLGGKKEDYDVIKVNTENWSYTIEATDGNTSSWNNLWSMCLAGFSSNANYFRLEGKDKFGKPVKGGEIMVDIDNLIDYMLVIFYTGNFDTPTSSFGNNKGCNNFFAIDNRNDKTRGFTFFAHDAEHSLFNEAHSPGIGLYEDRVNIGARTDYLKMDVSSISSFHPQWLHYKLSSNQEYRTRFADRAYMYFSEGGVFSPACSLERLNERVAQIETAVIAESARWGDGSRSGLPYTKNSNWLPEIDKIRTQFFPLRNQIVISQLNQAGLYSSIDAPQILRDGVSITTPDISFTDPFTILIRNTNGAGIIYYTLNGMDPRIVSGGICESALFSLNDFMLKINSSTIVTARVLKDRTWGPLRKMSFVKQEEDYNGLVVTEINYNQPDLIHGSDTTFGKDLEFIEFKNITTRSINLGGLSLDSAVTYTFPPNLLLPPGGFIVLASDEAEFYKYYGMIPSGIFKGNFSNSGEEILLKDQSGKKIIDLVYSDSYPWPGDADGKGYTLTSLSGKPTGDPADPAYWKSSYRKDGTPFADDDMPDPKNPVESSGGKLFGYPNPTYGDISIRLTSAYFSNNMDVYIYDTAGHIVARFSSSNPAVIDLTRFNIAQGVYFIRCTSGIYDARMRIVFLK